MSRWVTQPLGFLDHLVARFGDPFTLRYFNDDRFVVTGRPEHIKQILVDEASLVGCRVANEELRPFLGDGSLLILNGEEHRRHRKFFRHPFSAKQLLQHADMIGELTEESAHHLRRGQEFPVYPLIQGLSMEIILRVVLGVQTAERFRQIREASVAAMEAVTAPFLYIPLMQRDLGRWSPGHKVQAARRAIDELLFAEIARRRNEVSCASEDVLSALIAADEAGFSLTEVEIRDEVMTLLTAGHEPSTAAIAWALYWIHKHAHVERRLREELSTNASVERGAGTYLDAVCRETLRISPIILALTRRFSHDVWLQGHLLPAGTFLSACPYLAHRRVSTFPEPEKFDPERFLARSYSPYEFLPFGVGARQCIGMAFALQQMRVVLARLLRRYRFELSAGSCVVHAATRGAVVRPSSNLRLTVVEVMP